MRLFLLGIATFLGIGKLPKAPGTWASLAAIPVFWPLMPHPAAQAVLLAVLFFGTAPVCTWAEREMGETDPSAIVVDEVVGMGTALLGVPREVPFVLMAFILFRLFDIWKPYPIHKIQKLPGGWGILADDLLAGVYALIWVHIGNFIVRSIA